jgi:hypothetical protein
VLASALHRRGPLLPTSETTPSKPQPRLADSLHARGLAHLAGSHALKGGRAPPWGGDGGEPSRPPCHWWRAGRRVRWRPGQPSEVPAGAWRRPGEAKPHRKLPQAGRKAARARAAPVPVDVERRWTRPGGRAGVDGPRACFCGKGSTATTVYARAATEETEEEENVRQSFSLMVCWRQTAVRRWAATAAVCGPGRRRSNGCDPAAGGLASGGGQSGSQREPSSSCEIAVSKRA